MFISNLSPIFLAMYCLCISSHTKRPPLLCMSLVYLCRIPAPHPVVWASKCPRCSYFPPWMPYLPLITPKTLDWMTVLWVALLQSWENKTTPRLPSATTRTFLLMTFMHHHLHRPSPRPIDQAYAFAWMNHAWCPANYKRPFRACSHPRWCPRSSNQCPQSQGAQLLAFSICSF